MRVLLIDTCGEVGSAALAEGEAVVASELLTTRSSSSELLPAVARLLEQQGWELAELDGIGVVNGPGSFTGVRVGLAAAKGLCVGSGVAMASVSRLEVLAHAAGLQDGCAVLDAGRGELYVRVAWDGRELLCAPAELRSLDPKRVVVAESKLLEMLVAFAPELRQIAAADALLPVLRVLCAGGSDVALADANYVRGERHIYARTGKPA